MYIYKCNFFRNLSSLKITLPTGPLIRVVAPSQSRYITAQCIKLPLDYIYLSD